MSFPANLSKHRAAVLDMLEESFRDPERRSVMKTRGVSMRPLLRDQDEVVVQSVPIQMIGVGDLIAFKAGEVLLVHRVVAKTGDGAVPIFYEKGDNNIYLTPVAPERILGLVLEVNAGGRKLRLRARAFRMLGWCVAFYGCRAVGLFEACRRGGRALVTPGAQRSVALRRILHGTLLAPTAAVLWLARRFL